MTIAVYNEQLLSYFLFNTKLFTPHPLWGTWTHKSSSLCGLLFHHNLHRGRSSAFASASIRGCWVLTRQRLVEDRKSRPFGRVGKNSYIVQSQLEKMDASCSQFSCPLGMGGCLYGIYLECKYFWPRNSIIVTEILSSCSGTEEVPNPTKKRSWRSSWKQFRFIPRHSTAKITHWFWAELS